MNQELATFYRQWVIANGIGESIGLGGTFLLGYMAAPLIESDNVASIVSVALLAVALGTLLEGVVVGVAQSIPLRSVAPKISNTSWVLATAMGAGLAWLIGMVPSTTMALITHSSSESAPAEPPAILQYLFAVGLGFIAGPILGVAQWVVLRKHFSKALNWLLANAVAWAIGMPVIFVGMECVPWNAHWLLISLTVMLVGLVAGTAVGMIHGWFLIRLILKPNPKTA